MIKGKASSYGDAKDMADYQRALVSFLRAGYSQRVAEAKARKVGDPGIGWCDNVLSDTRTPWVALPVEDWKGRFGTKAKAHKARVRVTIGKRTVVCILGDTMPHRSNITNGAVIDLAPGAQAAFGLFPPFLVPCEWEWA
jgi:hypothetical protein